MRGPIDPARAGATLIHEHLAVDWDIGLGRPSRLQPNEALDRIEASCKAAAEVGIGCIVDAGTEQFGTSNELLAAAAKLTDIQIVAATGVYCADALPAPAWAFMPSDPEKIAAELIREAREGRAGSGVLPGIFKIGTSGRAVTGLEQRVFEGAAIAQRECGLALTTHTEATAHAEEQVDILERAGADLSRVIIGHFGWGSGPQDRELHRRIADRGVVLGLDMVGYGGESTIPDWTKMAVDLIEDGHAERIVLSHDQACYASGVEGVFDPADLTGDLGVVSRLLLPALGESGVPAETIDQVMTVTPRRVLTVAAKHRRPSRTELSS